MNSTIRSNSLNSLTSATAPFTRNRFTWLAYAMLAYYAYMQAALGTLMPYLRAELGASYTVGGLHLSAFALGMIMAGLSNDRITARVGRARVFWGGGAGMALGALGLLLSPHVSLTLSSALVMGFLGTLLLGAIQAMLADQHGAQRTQALTESNIAASIFATLAPLLVGSFQNIGVGWRAALGLGIGSLALLALAFRGAHVPASSQPHILAGERRTLPLAFWIYWLVLCLSVAVEWCLVFWGADFLTTHVRLQPAQATSTMSVFFAAVVLGRVVGSLLARRVAAGRLLWFALVLAIAGFPLFWLAPAAPLSIAGLFLAGLGVANLFPLTLSLALGIAPTQADAASARATLAGGIAILSLPLLLGGVADALGLFRAFGIVALLLLLAAAALWAANRTGNR